MADAEPLYRCPILEEMFGSDQADQYDEDAYCEYYPMGEMLMHLQHNGWTEAQREEWAETAKPHSGKEKTLFVTFEQLNQALEGLGSSPNPD
jgi:hypothetical protein